MNDIELRNHGLKSMPHARRTINSTKPTRRKIPYLDAIKVDGPTSRNGAVGCAIHIRGKDMHIMTELRESLCQTVHGINWTSVPRRRQIGRNNMKDTQLVALRYDFG